MTEHTPRANRQDTSWEVVKTFSHESGYMVRVQRLPLRRPRYSFEIGRTIPGGKFSRYFNPRVEWSGSQVSVGGTDINAIATLVEQAEKYIQEELQRLGNEKQTHHGGLEQAKPIVIMYSSRRYNGL